MELRILIIPEAADSWRIHLSPARVRVSDSTIGVDGDWRVSAEPDIGALEALLFAREATYSRRLLPGGSTELYVTGQACAEAFREWLAAVRD